MVGTPWSAGAAAMLRDVAEDPVLLEVGRRAIELVLVEFRDDRVSQLRGNGLVIKESDGTESSIIRIGPEDALRIGLRAIADKLEKYGALAPEGGEKCIG